MPQTTIVRLALIVLVVVAAHLSVIAIRSIGRRILRSRIRSESKVLTVTGFSTSVFMFVIYFSAFGFVLSELGVSLTTYLASASVIGLAVSFGSQGIVQDVITGLTLVFSDLIDVGDMAEIGGQIGIVESVGMRFTVLVNFSGAHVSIPNRSIVNLSSYPKGYIRAYLDARLPVDSTQSQAAQNRLAALADSAYEQYPGILLLPPTVEDSIETQGDYRFVRIKFRIWPGQGAVIENPVKASMIQAMRELDPNYADWMISVYYRAEPTSGKDGARLPRPHVLYKRTKR